MDIVAASALLLISAVMAGRWIPKAETHGWYSAVFFSALLSIAFSVTRIINGVTEIQFAASWAAELMWYAAVPMLAFVLSADAANISWPKEAWGRILLGVFGIYWLLKHYHVLPYWLFVSTLIATLAAILIAARQKPVNRVTAVIMIAASPILLNPFMEFGEASRIAALAALMAGCHLLFISQDKKAKTPE